MIWVILLVILRTRARGHCKSHGFRWREEFHGQKCQSRFSGTTSEIPTPA